MREEQAARVGSDQERLRESADPMVSGLDKRYSVALVLYAVLAALAWFTIGEGKVLVFGKWVEMRWLPMIIIGGLALRTVLARQAERIRHGGKRSE